ncbi:Hypothetical predicted protein [Mytilus galloprovincialis]|uniref:G-protein coupled receptors family 1 profile domain-containing protein n=1 Tax=Mytilus galloprovincialis TaxID=29158 RepID=A0A8B6ERC2_MYTGA|nr:Hypothetical predicted protein [Mytilus galloprovincialis]
MGEKSLLFLSVIISCAHPATRNIFVECVYTTYVSRNEPFAESSTSFGINISDNENITSTVSQMTISDISTGHPLTQTPSSDLKRIADDLRKIVFYVEPIVCVAGLILNVMGLIVFVSQHKHDNATNFIKCFLISNICLLVLQFFFFLSYRIKYIYKDSTATDIMKWVLLFSGVFLLYAVRAVTYAMYAVMSVNSFVAIAFPFYMNRFILSQHPKRTTFIIVLINLIVFSFNMFRFQYKAVTNLYTGKVSFIVQYTELASQNMNIFNVYGFVGILVTYLIPIPTTIVFFILTLISLKRSSTSKAVSSNDKLKEVKLNFTRRLTKIFLTVSFVQIVVGFPYMVFLIFAKVDNEFKIGGSKIYVGTILSLIFGTLDNVKHGAFPVLFFAMSSSFRESFCEMYFCKKSVNDRNIQISETSLTFGQ